MRMEIDVRAEIESYEWESARWSEDKLIAASPFRYDRSPSFFVRLEPGGIDEEGKEYSAGTWADSGAYDEEWRSGNIIKLLSFLRNETYEETREYLEEKYGIRDGERRELKPPRLQGRRKLRTVPERLVEPAESRYLNKRGISAEAQKIAGTGRAVEHYGFVALPWRTPDGRLANVKYRATKGKMFFYEGDGEPVTNLVWGADSVSPADMCFVCEAEIDALSWRTAGLQAVALGGMGLRDRQVEILRSLPCETLVLAGDNDKAGHSFNKRLARALHGKKDIGLFRWTNIEQKDANDVLRAYDAGTLELVGYENTVAIPRFKKLSV